MLFLVYARCAGLVCGTIVHPNDLTTSPHPHPFPVAAAFAASHAVHRKQQVQAQHCLWLRWRAKYHSGM